MLFLRTKDWILISGALLLLAVGGTLTRVQWSGPFTVLGLAIVLVIAFQLELFRRLQVYLDDRREMYDQTEALLSIFSLLKPETPLPAMQRWAARPDFVREVLSTIHWRRPRNVLELGSGTSTVLLGHGLRKWGGERLFSVEHSPDHANETRRALMRHGLDDVVDLRMAPLKPIAIREGTWQWYDPLVFENLPAIDLIVVDGPPGSLQKLSRYPTIPALVDRLSPQGAVLLDDGRRSDEQEIVRRWQAEYGFEAVFVPTERGAFLLTRSSRD